MEEMEFDDHVGGDDVAVRLKSLESGREKTGLDLPGRFF